MKLTKPRAKLISNDLVEVKPLSYPGNPLLYYVDFIYVDILEERRKKIEKIMKNIIEYENLDN